MAVILQLLDEGADVEAMPEERRPAVGDMVLVVSEKGKGNLATITEDKFNSRSEREIILQGVSCGNDWPSTRVGTTLQMTALTAAAGSGNVALTRLLLDRGAKADGKSGQAARRAAKGREIMALLAEHGATLTLFEECRDGNMSAIAQLMNGGADVEAVPKKRCPEIGDVVWIVGGQGAGSVATIANRVVDERGKNIYELQGANCSCGGYTEAQVSLQVTALTATAASGNV